MQVARMGNRMNDNVARWCVQRVVDVMGRGGGCRQKQQCGDVVGMGLLTVWMSSKA